MADFGALRTGHHVVRYRPSWRQRLFVVGGILGVLLLLYVMYEWGRFEGGYSKFAEVQRRRERTATIQSLRDANEKLRADVANVELARDVDRKAYADVEKNLADLQAQVLKHREELTFYRGIVSPEDGIGGLRVQRFQIVPGTADSHYVLRLVLVQSMRQDAVASGSVSIQVEGMRDNKPAQLSLSQLTSAPKADGQIPFQFRYFQNLEQDVLVPPDFEPRAVTVEVRSSKLAPVRESYPWKVQAES
ncbi:MAG TPA: DUF6776 family protein [Steroidobacteraceae bacterium]|jgi:hypothetical protein